MKELTKLMKILKVGSNGTIGTLNESFTSEDGCLAMTQMTSIMAAMITIDMAM